MAVTKIWAIKDSLSRVVDYATNPNKTIYSDLKNAIHYAENGEKTISEEACFVTGVNCNTDTAYEEMKKFKFILVRLQAMLPTTHIKVLRQAKSHPNNVIGLVSNLQNKCGAQIIKCL